MLKFVKGLKYWVIKSEMFADRPINISVAATKHVLLVQFTSGQSNKLFNVSYKIY